MIDTILTNYLLKFAAGEKGMTVIFYLLCIYRSNAHVCTAANGSKVSVHMFVKWCFHLFWWQMWWDSFIPRPGLHLSCTPACSGHGPAASGRWRCTSRWSCRKPRADAPTSPWWSYRSGRQPEHSLALSCRLEMAGEKKKGIDQCGCGRKLNKKPEKNRWKAWKEKVQQYM